MIVDFKLWTGVSCLGQANCTCRAAALTGGLDLLVLFGPRVGNVTCYLKAFATALESNSVPLCNMVTKASIALDLNLQPKSFLQQGSSLTA